jgi:hypothetical protein
MLSALGVASTYIWRGQVGHLLVLITIMLAPRLTPSKVTPSTNMIWMDLLLLVVKIQMLMPYFPRKLFLEKEVKF